MHSLVIDLETPFPKRLVIGGGNLLYLRGRCYDPDSELLRLSITVDGEPYPVRAHSVAVPESLDGTIDIDPGARVLTSRFWAAVPFVTTATEREVDIGVRAVRADRSVATANIGRLLLVPRLDTGGDRVGPRLAICSAVADPHVDLLAEQLRSFRAELNEDDWEWIIVDDRSHVAAGEALDALASSDRRVRVLRNAIRQGPISSLETALAAVSHDTRFVSVVQPHTTWTPGALSRAIDEMEGSRANAVLVVDGRSALPPDLRGSLLTSGPLHGVPLIRRHVLDTALPFPPDAGAFDATRWLVATSVAVGGASGTDLERDGRGAPRSFSLRDGRHAFSSLLRRAAEVSTVTLTQASVLASALLLRIADGGKDLPTIAGVDRSLVSAAKLRGARGEGPGPFASSVLVRMLTVYLRRKGPRMVEQRSAQSGGRTSEWLGRHLAKVEFDMSPLDIRPSATAPARVNILVPMLDDRYVFGAYLMIFHIAMAIRASGSRVRLLVVQEEFRHRVSLAQQLQRAPGLEGLLDSVEIEDATDRSKAIEVSPRDVFMATTSWTAYVAAAASTRLGHERFGFLIGEYDPLVFPTGSLRELSAGAYRLPHRAIFSTELLRTYFRAEGLGVYADGGDGDGLSIAIDNPIDHFELDASEIAARGIRKVLFYARVEEHAQRNLFELGVLALRSVARTSDVLSDVRVDGIGSLKSFAVDLSDDVVLNILPRVPLEEYRDLLGSYDVGIALQATPHPGLVALDMAAAGLVTVTNAFATKRTRDLTDISTNLIASEPTIEGVAAAITEALARAGDAQARVEGAALRWPRTWQQALDEGRAAQMLRLIGID